MERSLLIAGGTGLIGSAVAEIASTDARFKRVIAWGRKPVTGLAKPVEQWNPVHDDLIAGLRPERVDAVICCLGTTMRNVKGDKKAFLHVDRDLVLALGQWASGHGTRFCLVSAMGADPKSLFFYNRVKGEVEAALRMMDFAALHLFRPSILDGPRTEVRTGERLGLVAMKALRPLLPPDYRPMPHDTLAHALINAAAGTGTGTQVHTYRSILALAV
jgi:uncharacterized protein YbjT (DUF2867 family)